MIRCEEVTLPARKPLPLPVSKQDIGQTPDVKLSVITAVGSVLVCKNSVHHSSTLNITVSPRLTCVVEVSRDVSAN